MKRICTKLLVLLTLVSVVTVTSGITQALAAGSRPRYSDCGKRPVSTAAGEPDAGQTGRGSAITPPPEARTPRGWNGGGGAIPLRWSGLLWMSRYLR